MTAANRDIAITGLASDSRAVQPGYLFAALPGVRVDGRDFIADALARGAAAVLALPGTELPTARADVPLIVDENPRYRFALMTAAFFAPQPATVAAVTGTNGKTSVVTFLRQIWAAQGKPAAALGTLGIITNKTALPGNLTTPDPVSLHRTLNALAREGIDHVALEASSHGLDQYRLDGVRVAAAAFTNLSRDHLDYHGTEAIYLAAKLRLFTDVLADDGAAVVNADSAHAAPVIAACVQRDIPVLTVGGAGTALRLVAAERVGAGAQRLAIEAGGRVHDVILPLVGDFQVSNALVAAGLAMATGTAAADAIAALAHLQPVPGRLEWVVTLPNGAVVFVDYAHTPDALTAALRAVRPFAQGAVAVVFGCGGDRDRGKRPEMGRIAADLADRVIVTDDNPRSEDPAAIRRAILAACPGAIEIADRREAIARAIVDLAPGEILVVAGKGHESGQIVGTVVLPFDDRAVVREAAEAVVR